MDNPDDDPLVHINEKEIKQPNGSWRISGEPNREQIRIELGTLTGYARVVKTTGHEPNDSSDLDNVFLQYISIIYQRR